MGNLPGIFAAKGVSNIFPTLRNRQSDLRGGRPNATQSTLAERDCQLTRQQTSQKLGLVVFTLSSPLRMKGNRQNKIKFFPAP